MGFIVKIVLMETMGSFLCGHDALWLDAIQTYVEVALDSDNKCLYMTQVRYV